MGTTKQKEREDKLDNIIDVIDHMDDIDNNVFSLFDKLGCAHVKNVHIHRPDWERTERLYRKGNTSYSISYNSDTVYLYDENFNLKYVVLESWNFKDWKCPTCEHESHDSFRIEDKMSIFELKRQLKNWINKNK